MATILFDNIQIGRKFKSPGGITYKKLTATRCIPILDKNKKKITNGKETTIFASSKIQMEETN